MKNIHLLILLFTISSPVWSQNSCDSASFISDGTFLIPSGNRTYYYYKYVHQAEGKVHIKLSVPTWFSYGNEGCGNYFYPGSNIEEKTYFDFAVGDTIIFRFDQIADSINGSIEFSPYETGDVCSSAAIASDSSENYLPGSNYSDYWYKYYVPEITEGRLYFDMPEEGRLTVYAGNCEDRRRLNSINGDDNPVKFVEGFEALDTLSFKFYVENRDDFHWSMHLVEKQMGESCDNIDTTAVLGENYIPATPHKNYFYNYQLPPDATNKKLVVQSESEVEIAIKARYCTSSYNQVVGLSKAIYINPDPEDIIYIKFLNLEGGDISWNLSLEEYAPGDVCSSPLLIEKGVHKITDSKYWYKFVAPESDTFTIKSYGFTNKDTYLELYDSCQNSRLAYNDDHNGKEQSLLKHYLNAGEEILIYWRGNYETVGFEWSVFGSEDQIISFDDFNIKKYGDNDFIPNAVSNYGLPLAFTSSNEEVAIIEGQKIVIKNAGTTMITASQAGNDTIAAAVPVSRELIVEKGFQQLQYPDLGLIHINKNPFSLEASMNSGLPINFTIDGPATISGDIVSLTGEVGMVKVYTSQAGNENYYPDLDSISFEVVNPCLEMQLSMQKLSDAVCNGEATGAILAEITGAQEPFSFLLNGVAASRYDLVKLDAGDYQLTAIDAYACEQSISFTIEEPEGIQIQPDIVNSTQANGNGVINLHISGGNPPYSVEWNNVQTGRSMADLVPGIYSATVMDSNGCILEEEFEVEGATITSNQTQIESMFSLYPNPADQKLTIKQKNPQKTETLYVFDSRGRMLLHFNSNQELKDIDISQLTSGIYFMKSKRSTGVLKFVKY